ncbi:MAG: DUF3034 family protein [Pseudomonadota bacterium]
MKGLIGVNRYLPSCAALLAVSAALFSGGAWADLYNDGKVLATGGVSMTDGAGGGGITPWATITGYGTRDGINGDVHYTYVNLPNYALNSIGAAVGLWDRVELSYTNDVLTTGSTFNTVGLLTSTVGLPTGIAPWNTTIKMDVFGAKVRVFGEAIYDSDNLIPQVAIGGFYKINHNRALLKTLQASKSKDWEAYIAATKIFFPINTLVNVTLRYTAANETGLTGFGGPKGNKREIRPEVSLAYLLNKGTAIGVEYQKHGGNLEGQSVDLNGLVVPGDLLGSLTQHESDWYDAFIAFFPSKNLSITMAYAMLGNITLTPNQSGYYISLQASF